jgi:hypothetical protein
MEREEKEKIGGEKGKWGIRGLSQLVLGQNGVGTKIKMSSGHDVFL